MNSKSLLLLTVSVLLCPAAFAQRPLSEADLLKQIEALNPTRPSAAKVEAPPTAPALPLAPGPGPSLAPAPSLFDPALADAGKPPTAIPIPGGKKGKGGDKPKGPTEITSLEATFDQKANIAVFVGDVVVKDPEFNCWCDKMTAHLKAKSSPVAAAGPNGTPAPATPAPATPAPAGAKPGDAAAKDQRGGSLEKAVAETNSDRRVIITQEKTETDGTVTHSVGKADKAVYDTATGDIVLYGSPDVTQGTNRMVALTPETVITINRDGHLSSNGPTKSFLVEKDASGK